MKVRLAVFFFFLTSAIQAVYAQDVILKMTGEEINAIIIEVSADEVKYKRFDNELGPIYVTAKSDIFMIKYENGEKNVFAGAVSSVQNAVQYNYKNPVTAAWFSLLLPGLGQFYNGQTAKGIAMCVFTVGSYIMCFYSAVSISEYANNRDTMIAISLTSLIGSYVWSVVDAAVFANIINHRNQALSLNLGNDRKLLITPDILFSNSIGLKTNLQSPAYGLSLKLVF